MKAEYIESLCKYTGIFNNGVGTLIDLDNVSYVDIKRAESGAGSIVVYTGGFSVMLHGDDCKNFVEAYTAHKRASNFWQSDIEQELKGIHAFIRSVG